MSQPLNPTLFSQLKKRFGEVKIAKAGAELVCHRRQSVIPTQDGRRGSKLHIACSGEEYRVCCPWCSDTRFRLWINHRWGLPETEGTDYAWMIHCYNENCQADEGQNRIRQLLSMVFGMTNRNELSLRSNMRILSGERTSASLHVVEPPGAIIPLDNLEPQHRARVYLEERGYDPVALSLEYGIGYCAESHIPIASDRIFIPIKMNGQLVGWQGRYIGEKDWKRGPPKYYTCPGMAKSQALYNYDVARRHNFVVVCEGALDVWRVGPQAIALLGKSISGAQLQKITAVWGRGAAVLMLDSDAMDELEGLETELRGFFRQGIVKVFLPEGEDPGSMAHDKLWDMIIEESRVQKVQLLDHLRRE